MSAGWVEAARTRALVRPMGTADRIRSDTDLGRALDALDAVLALHRSDGYWCETCTWADDGRVRWPCPTVRAIEGTEDE